MACLGLALPNLVLPQHHLGKEKLFFLGDVSYMDLCGPYYTVLSYCMITPLMCASVD